MLPGRGGGANVGDEGPRLSVAGVVTGAFSPAAWLLGRWRVLACREGGEMSALGDFGGEAAGEGASPAGGKPKSPVGVVTRAAHAGSPPFDGVPVDGLGKPGEPEESRTRPRGSYDGRARGCKRGCLRTPWRAKRAPLHLCAR